VCILSENTSLSVSLSVHLLGLCLYAHFAQSETAAIEWDMLFLRGSKSNEKTCTINHIVVWLRHSSSFSTHQHHCFQPFLLNELWAYFSLTLNASFSTHFCDFDSTQLEGSSELWPSVFKNFLLIHVMDMACPTLLLPWKCHALQFS
jgi:hypothetical protein